MKFVITSGSVVSGLGKGICASSIGVLLQDLGVNVTAIKIDPYLNIDASLMSPGQHGEVYVLEDSGEVDLDFGSYERFLDITLTSKHSITGGKVYQKVLSKERGGGYLGNTVQVIPHITDTIQEMIMEAARIPVDGKGTIPEVCVVELGGTVGDIESMPFVEALRQLQVFPGVESVCNVHVTLLPIVNGEIKTKPAQNSVSMMRSAGLSPDILICRHDSTSELSDTTYDKLTKMCGLPLENVISLATEKILWNVPLIMERQHVATILKYYLNLSTSLTSIGKLSVWQNRLVERMRKAVKTIRIALVGKYVSNTDAYISVVRALQHAALDRNRKVEIDMIDAEKVSSENGSDLLGTADGIIVPGGFGNRGIDGLILSCEFARVHRIPFLGICLGFQLAVIEFARNVMGIDKAHSTEFSESAEPLVMQLPDYSSQISGASLRLGLHRTDLAPGSSIARSLYATDTIKERHRHRYEINPEYVKAIEQAGMKFTGTDRHRLRMEICELDDHPFFVGCQFHPEFQSRPLKPSPMFSGFVDAIIDGDI